MFYSRPLSSSKNFTNLSCRLQTYPKVRLEFSGSSRWVNTSDWEEQSLWSEMSAEWNIKETTLVIVWNFAVHEITILWGFFGFETWWTGMFCFWCAIYWLSFLIPQMYMKYVQASILIIPLALLLHRHGEEIVKCAVGLRSYASDRIWKSLLLFCPLLSEDHQLWD